MSSIQTSMRLTAIALVCSLSLVGCGKKDADNGAVKIGFSAPLTGAQAHLGKDAENGARLAIEDLNAQNLQIGGKPIKFELLSLDDQADGKVATTVAQKFVDDGVVGVIGHMNSGATIPASRIYNENGIVQISASATAVKYTNQGYKNAFRVMANDDQQSPALAEYAIKGAKAQRIAIIDDRTAYGQGIADGFEANIKKLGGTVVKREYTTDKASDFMAILTAIKASNPDLIFFGGMDTQAAPLVKQMKTLGIQAQYLGGDGSYTASFIKNAGAAAEGAIASLPGKPLEQMPKGPDFKKRYEAKHGKIELYATYNYDAVMVMVEAMKRANSTKPQDYLPEVAKTNHEGVTATIQFDDKGDLKNGAVALYKVEKGAWVALPAVQ